MHDEYTYRYPRALLTVDCVVFSEDEGARKVLLIQRDHPPFKGYWAFPGGYVEELEPLHQAAARELEEETGIADIHLTQLGAFGPLENDPRGWVVTVAYVGWLKSQSREFRAGDDARNVAWHAVKNNPPLTPAHQKIFNEALKQIGEYNPASESGE